MLTTVQRLFGERQRQLREERGLSAPELAERIGHQRAAVNQIERGDAAPGFRTLVLTADVLQVEPVDLFVFPTVHVRYEMMDLSRGVPFMAIVEMRDRVKEIRDRLVLPASEGAEPGRRGARGGRDTR